MVVAIVTEEEVAVVGEIVGMPPTTAVILPMSVRGLEVTTVTVTLGIEAMTSIRMTPEMLLLWTW